MKIEEVLRQLGYSVLAEYASAETNKYTLAMLQRFAMYMAAKKRRFDLIN
jgi:hypothetical protein